MTHKRWFLALCAIVLWCNASHGLIHKLDIRDDTRGTFKIETFGFFKGGVIKLQANNINVHGGNSSRVGFIFQKTDSDFNSFIDEEALANEKCFLKKAHDSDPSTIIPLDSTDNKKATFHTTIQDGDQGFYMVAFSNCNEHPQINFDLELEMFNPGPNYLTAGETSLPTLYTIFFFVYVVVLMGWLFYFMKGEGKKIFGIHHLMTLLVLLKILALLFKAIEFHYKKATGHPGGWAIVYYIFTGLKGITMFVVIALIGTGWAFIKPFLSERDKKIFLVVIPLQVLSNVAMVVIDETAPGSVGWLTWKEVFRSVDFICCGAILVPIIWSIKHLRDAAQIDGKAMRNMEKLKLFRQFYLMVITYIYFTRIVVYLMDATLPFSYGWIGDFFTEAATLTFWCATMYKFRPVADNPYFLSVGAEDSADEAQDEESK